MGKLKTIEEFTKQANLKHNDFYDYSNSIYVNALIKIEINCPLHGMFKQTPNEHLKGYKCVKCAGNNEMLTLEYIISESQKIHGDKYDYSLIDYKGNKKKVIIICKKHDKWLQSINDHLGGHGCPLCNSYKKSKKEEKLFLKIKNEFLDEIIIAQGKPKWIKITKTGSHSLDIYLPKYNIAIEYHGQQHFKEVKFFGGVDGFLKTQERDERKRLLCEQNGCRLFYFTYNKTHVPLDWHHKIYSDEQELINDIKKEINI